MNRENIILSGNNPKSAKKKFTSDVGITFFASLVELFCSFIFKPMLVYFLLAEGLGLWAITFTINELFIFVGGLGIPTAITKYVAEFQDDEHINNQIFSCGFINLFTSGLVVGTLLYFLSSPLADIFGMPELTNLIKIVAIFYPFSMIQVSLISLLNGLRKMEQIAYMTIFRSVSGVVLMLLFMISGWGIIGAVFGSVLSSLFTTAIAIYVVKDHILNLSLRNYIKTNKQIIGFGITTLAAGSLGLLTHKTDIIMLGYFLNAKEVGIYSVALALASMIWVFPKAISRVSFPAMSEYWGNKNVQALQKMVDMSTKYTLCVISLIVMFMFMFSSEIISMIFPKIDVASASLILKILLVGTLFHGIIVPIGSIFASTGKLRIVMLQSIIVAVSNITLNLILIPIFGIEGAAIATTASFILNYSFSVFYMKHLLSITLDTGWIIKLGFFSLFLISMYFILSSIVNQIVIAMVILSIYLVFMSFYFFKIEGKRLLCFFKSVI
jgi:O-antigen/teichoic acid export membrane protein